MIPVTAPSYFCLVNTEASFNQCPLHSCNELYHCNLEVDRSQGIGIGHQVEQAFDSS